MTYESLWNLYRDEVNDNVNENNPGNNRINNDKTIIRKSFEYKTKLMGSTQNSNNMLDAEVVVLLKYLSNFWRSLDLAFINCEIELDLSWSKECIISEISITPAVHGNPNANPPFPDVAAIQTTGATFQINNAKLYVPVVTFPPGMRRHSDVSFRSHIGRDVADHAETSSLHRSWYVNDTALFDTSLRRLIGV